MDLLLSCLHSLMLAALLLLLLTWRLCWKAHRYSVGWLPSKVGRQSAGLAAEGRHGAQGMTRAGLGD